MTVGGPSATVLLQFRFASLPAAASGTPGSAGHVVFSHVTSRIDATGRLDEMLVAPTNSARGVFTLAWRYS